MQTEYLHLTTCPFCAKQACCIVISSGVTVTAQTLACDACCAVNFHKVHLQPDHVTATTALLPCYQFILSMCRHRGSCRCR